MILHPLAQAILLPPLQPAFPSACEQHFPQWEGHRIQHLLISIFLRTLKYVPEGQKTCKGRGHVVGISATLAQRRMTLAEDWSSPYSLVTQPGSPEPALLFRACGADSTLAGSHVTAPLSGAVAIFANYENFHVFLYKSTIDNPLAVAFKPN